MLKDINAQIDWNRTVCRRDVNTLSHWRKLRNGRKVPQSMCYEFQINLENVYVSLQQRRWVIYEQISRRLWLCVCVTFKYLRFCPSEHFLEYTHVQWTGRFQSFNGKCVCFSWFLIDVSCVSTELTSSTTTDWYSHGNVHETMLSTM